MYQACNRLPSLMVCLSPVSEWYAIWTPLALGKLACHHHCLLLLSNVLIHPHLACPKIRARWPNANPETTGLWTNPTGYMPSAKSWSAPLNKPPATAINITEPMIATQLFSTFEMGHGGPVDIFHPPESYWGLVRIVKPQTPNRFYFAMYY
jgi:hypothetical protein